jgi:hypothetical protein
MLEISKDKLDNNLFLVGVSKALNRLNGEIIVNRIIDNYDLEGLNCLFISHSYKYSSIRPNCSTRFYKIYDDITKLVEDNLFRVNLLIISVDKNYSIILNSIRKITDLPIIFIGNSLEDFYKLDDFKYVYEMYKKPIELMSIDDSNWEEKSLSASFIKDIKNDWTTTLKDLIIEYNRDKKIEFLIKNKE